MKAKRSGYDGTGIGSWPKREDGRHDDRRRAKRWPVTQQPKEWWGIPEAVCRWHGWIRGRRTLTAIFVRIDRGAPTSTSSVETIRQRLPLAPTKCDNVWTIAAAQRLGFWWRSFWWPCSYVAAMCFAYVSVHFFRPTTTLRHRQSNDVEA